MTAQQTSEMRRVVVSTGRIDVVRADIPQPGPGEVLQAASPAHIKVLLAIDPGQDAIADAAAVQRQPGLAGSAGRDPRLRPVPGPGRDRSPRCGRIPPRTR